MTAQLGSQLRFEQTRRGRVGEEHLGKTERMHGKEREKDSMVAYLG